MSKVLATNVHVHRGLNDVVVLQAGASVPTWARDLISNPDVFVDAPAKPEPEKQTDSGSDADSGDGYDELTKAKLVALSKERELPGKGNKAELIAALREADAVPADTGDADEGEEDLFALSIDRLREIATERGVGFTEETSDVELATVLSESD